MSIIGEPPAGASPTEHALSGLGAKLVGKNGGPDQRFWFRSGLSLFTQSPIAPPHFLEQLEQSSIPAGDITTGDIVVFFQGDQLYRKQVGKSWCIDTSRINLLRLGVAHVTPTDQVRVISQDEHGNVWDHPIDELPGYNKDDWD